MGERGSWVLEAGEARCEAQGARDGGVSLVEFRGTARHGTARHVTARRSRGILAVAFPGMSLAVAWCHEPAEQRAAPAPAPG